MSMGQSARAQADLHGVFLEEHDPLPSTVWCEWVCDDRSGLRQAKTHYGGSFSPVRNDVQAEWWICNGTYWACVELGEVGEPDPYDSFETSQAAMEWADGVIAEWMSEQ
jgi:hypothetical protein